VVLRREKEGRSGQ